MAQNGLSRAGVPLQNFYVKIYCNFMYIQIERWKMEGKHYLVSLAEVVVVMATTRAITCCLLLAAKDVIVDMMGVMVVITGAALAANPRPLQTHLSCPACIASGNFILEFPSINSWSRLF